MKIFKNKNTTILFGELGAGDAFYASNANHLYMKIEQVTSSCGLVCNAVNLDNGMLLGFSANNPVEFAHVHIEDDKGGDLT